METTMRSAGRDPWEGDPSMGLDGIGMTDSPSQFTDGIIRPVEMSESSSASSSFSFPSTSSSPEDLGFVDTPDPSPSTNSTREMDEDWFRGNARPHHPNRTPAHFQFIKQLGNGSFAEVYLAREFDTKKDYAIKVVTKDVVSRTGTIHTLIREKNVLALLTHLKGGHPFVVSFYCTFQDEERLYFALSYCSRGDLLDNLKRVGSFDVHTTQFYSAEILVGLNFIHGSGIVHRDLKPENILFKDDGHICLTDFGSAKVLADPNDQFGVERARRLNVVANNIQRDENGVETTRRSTFVGTAQYVSPEMLDENADVGPASDIWALGGIMYYMLSGQPPFRAVNAKHIFEKIKNREFSFPPGFPETGQDLVDKLLVIEPEMRLGSPGRMAVADHPFFEGIVFETLHQQTPPQILPYLPASMGEPEFYSDIKTGFDRETLQRLELGIFNDIPKSVDDYNEKRMYPFDRMFGRHKQDYQVSVASPTSAPPGHEEETREERVARVRAAKMEKQKQTEWHQFAEENLIVHKGFVDKKKGLFARRRMFLLTEGPHIYYIDPVNMVYKGQIPLCFETKTEAKNFRTFFVHTPNRTYYLFDPARRADEWCKVIDNIRDAYFKEPTPRNADEDIIEITKLFGLIPFITFKTTRAARLAKEKRRQEQKERDERTAKAKKERLAREKEEKKQRMAMEEEQRKERKIQEKIEKEQKKEEKERKRREKKLGRH